MKHALTLALLALLATSGTAGNEDAAPPDVKVYPAEIELSTTRDRQSFVVQLTQPDGVTRDLTDEAKVTLAQPLAELKGNMLTPAADG